MIVVSDSTPLIALSIIGRINLLKDYFKEIYIPPEVYQEIVVLGDKRPGSNVVSSAGWIKVKEVENTVAVHSMAINLHKANLRPLFLLQKLMTF